MFCIWYLFERIQRYYANGLDMPDNTLCFTMSLDGKYLYSGVRNKNVYSFEITDKESNGCTNTYFGHTDSVTSVVVSSNGKILFTSADREIKVWKIGMGICVATLEGHTSPITGLALSSDDNILVSCGGHDGIRTWLVHQYTTDIQGKLIIYMDNFF